MKIISIGDCHGRNFWKRIVEQEKDADKFIFIGDYFDTKESYSAERQVVNFNEILAFKEANPDKVVLLLGNHCFHYLTNAGEDYSGHQYWSASKINAVLQPAVDSGLIKICHVHDKYVFSHAGITKTWLEENNFDLTDFENQINQRIIDDLRAFRFSVGVNMDFTGDDVTQGPLWVRIPSLIKDKLDGYTFVVGHTMLKELTITEAVICIDTLGTTQEYLIIENNLPKIGKLIL